MLKKVIVLVLLTIAGLHSKAQSDGFVHFTPIPDHTPPDGYMHYTPIPLYNPPPLEPLPPLTYNSIPLPPRPPTIHSVYIIKGATINGQDVTHPYVVSRSGIMFYSEGELPYNKMMIFMPGNNSKSYGGMSEPVISETPASQTSNRKSQSSFRWYYTNSYDGTSGKAYVTLYKEYTPNGVTFDCLIQSQDGGNVEFTGVLSQL